MIIIYSLIVYKDIIVQILISRISNIAVQILNKHFVHYRKLTSYASGRRVSTEHHDRTLEKSLIYKIIRTSYKKMCKNRKKCVKIPRDGMGGRWKRSRSLA